MDCRLIAFDLDNTFLDDDKNVPAENSEALAAAAERGICIVPATGRLYPYIPDPVRTLPFVRYCILCNGGMVYDAQEDKTLYTAEIPYELTLRVFDRINSVDALHDVYMDNCGYFDESFPVRADDYFLDPLMNQMLHSYIVKSRRPVPDLRRFVEDQRRPVQKIQMFFRDQALRLAMLEQLPEEFPELRFTSSLANNIEINSKNASKGGALRALCTLLGFGTEQAVAFGDGLNDLDMLQTAGCGVAMVNGDASVRAAADVISVDTNNGAGVGKTLKALGIV